MTMDVAASNSARLRARTRLRMPGLRMAGRLAGCLILLACAHLPALATSHERAPEDPNRVKAAFLRNFAHYVTWPATALPASGLPWHVCILGGDPFGDVLEKTFGGRTEQGRRFEIFRADTLDTLPRCQIIFIAYKSAAYTRAVLAALSDQPVLTVGESSDFLQQGGIIQFRVGDRVEMSINLDQARAASLKVQTKMLEVAREVTENGAVRRWK